MSSEVSNTNNSSSSIASYALMPATYVGVNLINNARYFKKAAPDFGKKGSDFGKLTNGVKYDTFQKAQFTSESFEAYRRKGQGRLFLYFKISNPRGKLKDF